MTGSPDGMNRRDFLGTTAAAIAGSVVLPHTALSYTRILGANDRISLGHIGIGSRGSELDWIAAQLKTQHNAEMTAVCDLWEINRERAVSANTKFYGRPPRAFA